MTMKIDLHLVWLNNNDEYLVTLKKVTYTEIIKICHLKVIGIIY